MSTWDGYQGRIIYNDFHDQVVDWIIYGKWQFTGSMSMDYWCDLDTFLFNLLDVPINEDDNEGTRWRKMNKAISEWTINLEWVRGPNAFTVFKALVAARNPHI